MNKIQKTILYMKTVRALSEKGIILTDEVLRAAGIKGTEAGEKLREIKKR
jgi:hypothetical protein